MDLYVISSTRETVDLEDVNWWNIQRYPSSLVSLRCYYDLNNRVELRKFVTVEAIFVM